MNDDSLSISELQTIGAVGVFGFGNVGQAFARIFRARNVPVFVSGFDGGQSAARAQEDGFAFLPASQLSQNVITVFLAAPDHVMEMRWAEIRKSFPLETLLIFAHGWVAYRKKLREQEGCYGMIAPKGAGAKLWERFQHGSGLYLVTDVLGVMGAQRQSDLELRVKVLAKALGGEREGVVQARAEHECIADLISEQMVLCGGLPMLMAKTMEWMVAQGIPQRLAWVECVYEARMMAEMYESQGLLKTFKKISPAAATGGLEAAKMMESQIEKWIGERAAHLAPKIDTSRERSFPESWKHADEAKPC